jgi:hypothetical protein
MRLVAIIRAAAAVAVVAATASLPACRSSTDKPAAEPSSDLTSAAEKADSTDKVPAKSPFQSPTHAPSGKEIDCKVNPDSAGSPCCEALTPTCNECRAKAAKALEAWKAACEKPAARPAECNEKLPSVACCPEATAACNACRSAALNKLLERRARCGEPPTP